MNEIADKKFVEALPIIHQLEEAGFEAYFVGGSVRDALLNKEINDVDIATSAFPDEVKEIFPKTIDVGIEHGTVMVIWKGEPYEVTTFRTESTYQDFRRPDKVTFVRSLEEDLKRRDFTVNALAMSRNMEVIDFFEGQKDLANKLVRAVGSPKERFYEDALRMMRGVRFVSQLDFFLDEETKRAIKQHQSLLSKIAIERVQVEFIKLLLGKGRKKGLCVFIETGLYQYCPGLKDHKKELEQFSRISGSIETSLTAWTLLLFFLKKTPEETDSFLRLWKCSKKEIQGVKTALTALNWRLQQPWDKITLYRTGLAIALEVEAMAVMLRVETNPENVQTLYGELPIHQKNEIDVTGNDLLQRLDKKPGKWLGKMIDHIEIAILTGEVLNQKEQILQWAETHMDNFPN